MKSLVNQSICLAVLLALLFLPPSAGAQMRCADGMPCAPARPAAARLQDCCQPLPCNEAPRRHDDPRCVIDLRRNARAGTDGGAFTPAPLGHLHRPSYTPPANF